MRYARWDMRSVDLVDPHTKAVLCPLYPLDKTANADGRRRRVEPSTLHSPPSQEAPAAPSGLAPLLRQLMEEYAATGLPPAYVPKSRPDEENEE